ncbi:hypothetical protein ASG90_02395 [Nocardioides sp. Soil797]|nr:hypothetical protein ASG90_02395 [Nocardioides sp. Soil797]
MFSARLRRGLTALVVTALAGTATIASGPAGAASPHAGDDNHVPATMLSDEALAAESCAIPGNADDAVIVILDKIADSRGVSSKVRLAMFEAAWVESHAHSLPCGDSDSAGVFQQRPSAGWGTVTQVQDPTYATNKFLDGNGTAGAIKVAADHPTWSAGQVAQRVQGSAFPDRYDAAASTAKALINRANGIAAGTIDGGSFTWPTVQTGEKNNRVKVLQHLLNQRGYGLTVDGSFGPATLSAVKRFQTSAGLGSDGVVGPLTWSKVVVSLSSGTKGNAVKGVQQALNAHGFKLVVDGSYGTLTANAVTTLRSRYDLPGGTSTDAAVWNSLIALKR